ncbi:DNA-directed RNA polymerase [Thamnocephalis sphaerospora]|uniref:DNA-directed RNA polymerase n=1 Tax=Thamnocephalis sphaerospora TaxID=78915 RepID=A0A4V1IVV9_9FUNG|nr:DNA-directed RNA polymerase [Thamnocephalis sphaerospora]|eukprot:RKP05419.1 DNA-directed RNA polymerase [Thamnocephalis sphaerospora]
MAQADRFNFFTDQDEAPKLRMELDTKIPNAATFVIEKEDHTLGNMLKTQMLKDPAVLFAGYQVPHPLEHRVKIKVQTDDEYTPVNAMRKSIHQLQNTLGTLKARFKDEATRARLEAPSEYGAQMGTRRGMDMDF